ncbi:TIGR03032 family protein [Tumidithrix helvetica PCC 7403]|uniref:TIGR03032 family protein n=1 Tax=Tumidithrix helvetica TaxID=3457545 RepID=UPI003C96316A
MTESKGTSESSFLHIYSSDRLWEWLEKEQISIGFTTYQTNRLMLVGRKTNGRLAFHERLFDKPMGLYAQDDRLYMSTRYQIWRFDNHLANGETYQEADRLYVPSLSYTTGSLNVHDLVLGRDGTPIFINTDFSCLATIAEGYSFAPIWQPPFITKLVAEDRCHLNGLAMVEGEPSYVTACSMTDSAAGWRSHRNDGGIVMHIPSNEVVVGNLSMPHSPRWYQGKLWLLNAGTGELGYVDDHKFVPIAFCQGFVRGLAFWGDLAIVGLSKLRSASFSGLVLEERLLAEGKTAQCGLVVFNLRTGETVHSLFLDKPIEELFDVVVLPNVVRPMSLGFQNEDIERLVTFPNSHGLVTTKPTVKRPRDNSLAIAGLPTKERVQRENQEAREYEAMERQELAEAKVTGAKIAEAKIKFQRVFHLNRESLAPYDAMTFPNLQQRWQSQPQRGEVIGVSASFLGDMVGFAIAELLPDFKAEIISLFVDPDHRQKGVGTKMLAFLEREIFQQKFSQITLIYEPTALTDKALEPIFVKLGWAAPRSLANGLKVAQKVLSPKVNPVSEAAKLKFEEGKNQAQAQNLAQAIACFQEAIGLQPDYVAAYNQLGNALQGLGQSEQAIAIYQKILTINPNVAAAHCNLGSIYQLQGKYEQAIAAYQKAIELKPDFALAHRNLGGLLASQGRSDIPRAAPES